MLDKICEELGIEVGEDWIEKDGRKYMVTEYGQVKVWNTENEEWIEAYYNLGHIVIGELKPKWKPKKKEKYYYPEIAYNTYWGVSFWENNPVDKIRLERGIAFKTKEEAIEAANRIIELYKEDK